MQFHPSGTRIANRYEVAGRPLVGGMGVVYLCFDHTEQRPVALKTFKPEFLPDRAARERFLEEGNTWVQLGKHPHIVRCYRVFQDRPRPEVYLALELIAKEEGRRDASLRSWLKPGKPLPTDQALLIALQIVRGMRHATETIPGFVHRDLKPENILIGADRLGNAPINRIRVTDFGLVKGIRAEQAPTATAAELTQGVSRLTRIGSIVGTPHYMAPEQWEGADVTVQADIYALGCVLGEMLTGRMLVQGTTLSEVRQGHQDGQAMKAMHSAPDFVRGLLAECLAVKPARRNRDWEKLEVALVAVYDQITNRPAPPAETAGALSRADRVAVGWSYSEMGGSYLNIGGAKQAVSYFERALAVGMSDRQRALAGAAIGNLGIAYFQLGEARRAIGYYEQWLTIAHEIGDRKGEGAALVNLGLAHTALGDASRAIEFFQQWLAIAREIIDRWGEGNALGNLGIAYATLGDPRRAISYYEQALIIRREVGDWQGEGTDLGNLGAAYLRLGAARQAVGYLEQSLAIRRKTGDRRGESADLCNLGTAYDHLSDLRRAIAYYEQALAMYREIGDRRGEGNVQANLGRAYRQLGNLRQAISHNQQALAICREIGDRSGEGGVLANLGNGYADLGDIGRAIDHNEQALAIRREIGDVHGMASNSFNMALLYRRENQPEKALPLAREAARLWSKMGNIAYAQRARQLVTELERQER